MKKSILVGLIFASIIAGITAGILLHDYSNASLEKATLEEVKNANQLIARQSNVIATATKEVKTTPNTKIVYETLYLGCSHLESVTEEIDNDDVNKNEEFFVDKYKEWNVNNFSEDMVELYKEEAGICDKHYIVKEKDGRIAIYNLDSAGNQNLKEITDVYINYLPEEDIELLKKGINVTGDNELAKVIEDYE